MRKHHPYSNNSCCYNVAWKQNSCLPSQFPLLRAGWALHGWERKGIPHSQSQLSQAPFHSFPHSFCRIQAYCFFFSAVTTSSKKPGIPGVSFSLVYKSIFASEPPTDPLFLPMCTESKGRRKTERGSIGRFLSYFMYLYSCAIIRKLDVYWILRIGENRMDGKAETLIRGTQLHEGEESGPEVYRRGWSGDEDLGWDPVAAAPYCSLPGSPVSHRHNPLIGLSEAPFEALSIAWRLANTIRV